MLSNNQRKYIENLKCEPLKWVSFLSDIYYPRINNKTPATITPPTPVMQTLALSQEGICFISKLPIASGDFVAFSIQFKNRPSIGCLLAIETVIFENEMYLAEGKFYLLTDRDRNTIKEYVKNH